MYTKKKFFKIVSYKIVCLSTLIFAFILSSNAQGKIFKMDNLNLVRRIGVEPITSGAEIRRSIQLKLPAQYE